MSRNESDSPLSKFVVVVRNDSEDDSPTLSAYGPFHTRPGAETWGVNNDEQFKGDWHILPIIPPF